MEGPTRLVMATGRCFQRRIAHAYFGFCGLISGSVPAWVQYSHTRGTGRAPHCSLNLKVPPSGVLRPKSNFLKPCLMENLIASQYKSMFPQRCRYSRSDPAHGISTVSLKVMISPAATGCSWRRPTKIFVEDGKFVRMAWKNSFPYTGVPRSRIFRANT